MSGASASDRTDQASLTERHEAGVNGQAPLDAARLAACIAQYEPELRRMVLGVVRDPDLAGDVLQATFTRAVESGHNARAETFKGWLFQVAFREALTVKRRSATRDRAWRRLVERGADSPESPEQGLMRREVIEAVRHALDVLPPSQRQVVRARIYEDQTFAEIAAGLGLPLGTVLTRMRRALEKLRQVLPPH